MYIINKVTEDYEGTWANALMYETDLNKAIEIANELQEAMVTLKQKYVDIKTQINFVLKRQYPNYNSSDTSISFEDQMKSIDKSDSENYFDKEERLLKEATDKILTDKEKLLYNVTYMAISYQLMYFEVRELHLAEKVLNMPVDKENFWNILHSTKEQAQKHKKLFETFIQ